MEWQALTGVDADLFNFGSSSGALTFNIAPDFEDPQDDDRDNVYLVNVNATDGNWTGTSYLTITVTGVNRGSHDNG